MAKLAGFSFDGIFYDTIYKMNIWDWGREQTMKIGICDDRYEIRHKVKEILQETYTEEQGFLIHSYTPNEIKIDIEDMVFDCEILIMNTDYPESG